MSCYHENAFTIRQAVIFFISDLYEKLTPGGTGAFKQLARQRVKIYSCNQKFALLQFELSVFSALKQKQTIAEGFAVSQ